MGKAAFILWAGIVLLKGCLGVQVDVSPSWQLVLPGKNATFVCRAGVALQYCRVEIPGENPVNLNSKLSDPKISYFGHGLGAGYCGFTINRVSESMNGDIKCTLGVETESQESVGQMQLIVAKAPKQPVMQLSSSESTLHNINDQLIASCMVENGRPVANISWFLDEELIYRDGLSMPTVKDLAKENLQTKIQNYTRLLQASDNGKTLRCVAYHPAYPNGQREVNRVLEVRYKPLPLENPIDKFGYNIGQPGIVSIEIESNPKPQIKWLIDGEQIEEGSSDKTGTLYADHIKELGRGRYEVSLRIAAIKKEDTEKLYTLSAYNNQGSQEYNIKISTSPEPEGVELGVGGIVGIVVGILILLLIVFILIFAKVTGRWCFTPSGDTRQITESSDTESTEVRPTKGSRLSPIKLTSFFKKNREKLQAENDEEIREPDTDVVKIPLEPEIIEKENLELQTETPNNKEGLVYAELDLVSPQMKPVVKKDDEKTEYAEIVYTKEGDKDNKEEQKS